MVKKNNDLFAYLTYSLNFKSESNSFGLTGTLHTSIYEVTDLVGTSVIKCPSFMMNKTRALYDEVTFKSVTSDISNRFVRRLTKFDRFFHIIFRKRAIRE